MSTSKYKIAITLLLMDISDLDKNTDIFWFLQVCSQIQNIGQY